jgi:ATP/maltotriose-dependent transcriptional regulator MalT
MDRESRWESRIHVSRRGIAIHGSGLAVVCLRNGDTSTLDDVADKIATRYGILDRKLSHAALQTIVLTTANAITMLDEAHRLVRLLDVPDTHVGHQTPRQRWEQLLRNLFPASILVVDPHGSASPDLVNLPAGSDDDERAVRRLLNAAAAFLLAETTTLEDAVDLSQHWVGPDPAGSDVGLDTAEKILSRATRASRTLLDHAESGRWRDLLAAYAPQPRTPASPTHTPSEQKHRTMQVFVSHRRTSPAPHLDLHPSQLFLPVFGGFSAGKSSSDRRGENTKMQIYQPMLFVGLDGRSVGLGGRWLREVLCGPDGTQLQPTMRGNFLPYHLPSCPQCVYADLNEDKFGNLERRVVPSPEHLPAAELTMRLFRNLVPAYGNYPVAAHSLLTQVIREHAMELVLRERAAVVTRVRVRDVVWEGMQQASLYCIDFTRPTPPPNDLAWWCAESFSLSRSVGCSRCTTASTLVGDMAACADRYVTLVNGLAAPPIDAKYPVHLVLASVVREDVHRPGATSLVDVAGGTLAVPWHYLAVPWHYLAVPWHYLAVQHSAMQAATPAPTGEGHDHVGRQAWVERPSVDELLDRAAQRWICVVIGAAGWGKTTAVAAWSRSRPTAWLRYEDHAADADRLLDSLVKTLRTHVSGPAPILGTAALTTGQVGSSVEAICAWLHSVLIKDLVLVMDDLHVLESNSDAAGIVEGLCQQVPDRLHLVLVSRRELPFSLQRLRGRGLVSEIHAQDLAFDVADVEALLRKTVGEDPPGLSRRVWEHTSGWAAAVHSVVELLRVIGPDQRLGAVEQLCRPGERFHGYLAEEVIGTAPEWVQQLLRRFAVFGEVRFTTEIAGGLAELSRQGLIQRSGADSTGWSLVRPLRDYFEHEAAPSARERRTLHVTAANECIGRGAQAEALRHLLAAGDHPASVSLLVNHGDAIVDRGHLDPVLEAAELPAEYLDDPRIQRVLGQAQQVRGRWAQALQHFQRAGLDRDELEPALSWRVGMIAFARGEFAEVQALTQRTRWDREDTLDETRVLALSASAHRIVGDLMGLQKVAVRARAAAQRCGDPRAWSHVHHVLAVLAAAEGDWRQAAAHCTDALRNAEASDDLLRLMWIRASRAFHQLEMGAPRQALVDAQIVLSLSERCENPFLVAHALTTRGRACGRVGMLEEAAGNFATAIDLFQRLGSRFLAWPLCGLGDLHRTRGQLIRAQAAYEEALTLAEPCHDIFGLSSALIGLARIAAADDLMQARKLADRAVTLGEGLREVAALLTRGWVELMGGDQPRASADADQAAVAARKRRDNPGLAEAITLGVLASRDPAVAATPLREAIDIWQETGCRLEEAATRIVAGRISAPIPGINADLADRMLRDYGVDFESRAAGPLGVLVHSAPAVTIQTLGVFQVIREGVPVPTTKWKSKKARDLLKILIARRRPTPRDLLMELLWPGVDPTVAGNRLAGLLSTVRDVLQPHPTGESPLVTTGGAVSLNRAQVSVDVEDFLTQATAALDADRTQEPNATALLAAAVTAHTGNFLEGDPYQEWAGGLAEEVWATHIALLRALSVRLREAGDTDAAVRYTLRLLEQDRYDKQAHLSLVGVLRDAGRLGEARRHYQSYVQRMKEIDVRPSPLSEMQISAFVVEGLTGGVSGLEQQNGL